MALKAPLKQDIKMLGSLLGDTIKTQVGQEFFDKLENIRLLSKRARKNNDEEADKELKDLIRGLSNEELKNLVRAFGQFLKPCEPRRSSSHYERPQKLRRGC